MHSRHLRLMTTELPPLTIREYEPGDEEAILATFNRIFAEVDPTFTPRTLASWRWAYRDNPSGWRIFVALTDEGEVVAQYAGLGQRMRIEGEPASFSQSVDTMVDPRWRLVVDDPLFVRTARPYGDRYGGPPPKKDVVFWGLPVASAWRMGRLHLDYEMIRTPLALGCPPERLVAGEAPGVEVEETDAFPEEVEDLFERCAPSHGAIAVRDRAHLAWRFSDHPDHDYRVALARRGGTLVGYAVFRAGAFDGEDDLGLVCDWLVADGEDGSAEALRAWAAERTRAEGAGRTVALFPEYVPEWLAFQRAGYRAAPTSYVLAGKSFVKRIGARWLFENWYTTLGDTDLV